MKAVPAAVVAGAIVIAGKWAVGKEPTVENGVGIAGIAVGLALLEQANPKVASAFAWLIVLSVALIHLPKIADAVSGPKKNIGQAGKGAGF